MGMHTVTVEKLGRSDKPAANRIAVVVLGMHRSGTSALTRVLSLLGCDLPKTLMGTTPANELGHWESTLVAHLNDEILSSAGSNWHDWLSINPGWSASPKSAEFKEKAVEVVQAEFGTSRFFVLKDPRICRLTPFWLEVLKEAGVDPAIIMPVRNPLEVAQSLASRDGLDPALGQLLWLRHVLEAEAGSRGLLRYHTTYDALMANWAKLAVGVQEQLGISWPRMSPMASEEIDDFLAKGMRHYQESPASVSDNPLLSAWMRESFDVFVRWAEVGEDEADYKVLDGIRQELDISVPAFARLVTAGQRSAAIAKQLDARLSEARDKLGQAEATAAAQQAQVEGLAQQLADAKAALATSQSNSEQKQQQLGEISGRLAEAQAELTRVQGEVQALQAALEEARGELSQTQSALAQRSAEADDVSDQLRRASESLAEAESARQRDAERTGEEIATLTRLLRDKDEECRRAGDELSKLRAEKGTLEGRLAERFNELAVITRLLTARESDLKESGEQVAWLREVSSVLLNGSISRTLKGRLAALMPARMRLSKQKERLKNTGTFNPDAYLAANPDVAQAGLDPLRHYIEHGIAEGRPLAVDSELGVTQGRS